MDFHSCRAEEKQLLPANLEMVCLFLCKNPAPNCEKVILGIFSVAKTCPKHSTDEPWLQQGLSLIKWFSLWGHRVWVNTSCCILMGYGSGIVFPSHLSSHVSEVFLSCFWWMLSRSNCLSEIKGENRTVCCKGFGKDGGEQGKDWRRGWCFCRRYKGCWKHCSFCPRHRCTDNSNQRCS